MRARINAVYRRPLKTEFYQHFRDDLGLTDDHIKIMDSLREHYADSQFHYYNTMIPEARFEVLLKQMTDTHMTELIRLAQIGFDTENTRKTEEE